VVSTEFEFCFPLLVLLDRESLIVVLLFTSDGIDFKFCEFFVTTGAELGFELLDTGLLTDELLFTSDGIGFWGMVCFLSTLMPPFDDPKTVFVGIVGGGGGVLLGLMFGTVVCGLIDFSILFVRRRGGGGGGAFFVTALELFDVTRFVCPCLVDFDCGLEFLTIVSTSGSIVSMIKRN
jgi:hypothetical protein